MNMRVGSTSTNSRSSSHSRRYRTLAPSSQVDETLFGSSKPKPSGSVKHGRTTAKTKEQPPRTQKGETLQIITKDLIRNLKIPQEDPSGKSVILTPAEFEQINVRSQVLTKEELQAMKKAALEKREEEMKAVQERNQHIFQLDLSHKGIHTLSEMEVEAQERAMRLRERANALRMEQEEEIKNLNMLILGAQCQATRDAQIQEKKQIQAELLDEDRRLDAMMEVDRRKALETMEKIEELRKKQRISGMQEINEQIQQRWEERQVQDEMKEMEKQHFREKQERMNMEDLQALLRKKEEQQRLQEEIRRINDETVRAKELKKEKERLNDLRDLEYIRKKLEKEAAYEAEQEQIKKDKELEIARLRARQEKAKDYQAEQDELRARRNQESTDREWRRKEKELALKKAQEDAMLKAARLEQIQCKEHCLSIEAGREKAEFERVLKVQQEAIIKQKEEEEKQRQKALHHAEAIRQQVKERELIAITKRRETFKEADQLREEARRRNMHIAEIKEKKLRDLRATGLSEVHCSEVERKAWASLQ